MCNTCQATSRRLVHTSRTNKNNQTASITDTAVAPSTKMLGSRHHICLTASILSRFCCWTLQSQYRQFRMDTVYSAMSKIPRDTTLVATSSMCSCGQTVTFQSRTLSTFHSILKPEMVIIARAICTRIATNCTNAWLFHWPENILQNIQC